MKKEIKDYLHLYLGCKVVFNEKLKAVITHKLLADNLVPKEKLKPILRPLSDMTEDEDQEFEYIRYKKDLSIYEGTAMQTAYLLSKNFDLFGLIESGLAIDATTLKEGERSK